MNFWRRSIHQVRTAHRDSARSRRAPSRGRRFQLENLEGRALLTTYTLSEHFVGSQADVVVQVNNNPPTDHLVTASPTQPFVLPTDGGFDTINILDTWAKVPVAVQAGNWDTVNVGSAAGSVQEIVAPVTIDNTASYNNISINDSADAMSKTVVLSTVMGMDGASWGQVTGLAPAAISYKYAHTIQVTVTTGWGDNAVDVQATGVQTDITDNGMATVNVGNAGSVQGIVGPLFITDPPLLNTLNIGDQADPTSRTVVLSTYTPAPSPPWGEISGLAPATINYKYRDTYSVNLTTGWGGTVDVQATGAPTHITDEGWTTVDVGNAGSVQGIVAPLFISNPSGWDVLDVDASADKTGGFVLSWLPAGPDGRPWYSITGVAPASINFAQGGIYGFTISTG